MVMPIGCDCRANTLRRRDPSSPHPARRPTRRQCHRIQARPPRASTARRASAALRARRNTLRRDAAPSPPEYTTSVSAASRKVPVAPTDVARHGYEAQVWHRDHCGFLWRRCRSNRRPRPARRSSQKPARKCTSSSSGTPQRISCANAFGMLFGRAESCLINARTQLAMHRQGGDRPSGHDHAIHFGRKARSPEGTAGRSLRTQSVRT